MVRRHEKIIFSVCFFYATHDVLFDEIRQEVLVSLFKGYRNFRQECSESTWVYKVCINTCLFSLRKLTPKIKMVSFDEMPVVYFQDDNALLRIKRCDDVRGNKMAEPAFASTAILSLPRGNHCFTASI